MTKFQDGPAKGKTLMLKRSPIFLRVVTVRDSVDALDQPDDRPRKGEVCFAYILTGKPGSCHIKAAKGRSGFYPIAEYRLAPSQPNQRVMHDDGLWSVWCEANRAHVPDELRDLVHAGPPATERTGTCRVCGCTEMDCRICIERTGAPCAWADYTRTICTACGIRIIVRSHSHDNYARVKGWKVTASCTSSPAAAAQRAAEKFFGSRPFDIEMKKRGDIVNEHPYEFEAIARKDAA